MDALFLHLLNLSLTAGWLVLAVIAVRLLLRRTPRWIFCALWALVAVRLLCPVSLESALSLIPSAEPVPPAILQADTPEIASGFAPLNDAVNPILSETLSPDAAPTGAVTPSQTVTPVQTAAHIAAWVWLAGMAAMLLWALISWARLRMQLRTAVRGDGRVWQSERVATPFVLGLFRPRIYLPFSLDGDDAAYVLAHENAHIRRRDHWIKPFGFLLLAVYWFHPLIWVAYALLCRDIEMACDERVARALDTEQRRAYSTALLRYSVRSHTLAACPLAFGEVGVKERVKTVLNYKKPALWVIAAALVACVTLTVCFLTNPKTEASEPPSSSVFSSGKILKTADDADGVSLTLAGVTFENGTPILHTTGQPDAAYDIALTDTTFENGTLIVHTTWQHDTAYDITFKEDLLLDREENGEWVNCYSSGTAANAIAHILEADQSAEKPYNTAALSMTTPGKYRLTTTCLFDKAPPFTTDEQTRLSVIFEYDGSGKISGVNQSSLSTTPPDETRIVYYDIDADGDGQVDTGHSLIVDANGNPLSTTPPDETTVPPPTGETRIHYYDIDADGDGQVDTTRSIALPAET